MPPTFTTTHSPESRCCGSHVAFSRSGCSRLSRSLSATASSRVIDLEATGSATRFARLGIDRSSLRRGGELAYERVGERVRPLRRQHRVERAVGCRWLQRGQGDPGQLDALEQPRGD
jgi:hypothetical protein